MPDVLPEDTEPEVDVTELFSPLDETVLGPSLGRRPDDYPGFESLEVLLTAGGRYKAGIIVSARSQWIAQSTQGRRLLVGVAVFMPGLVDRGAGPGPCASSRHIKGPSQIRDTRPSGRRGV